MSNESCILTTKDFTIIEVMHDRCLGSGDPLAPILKRKIETALVVFREDVPVNVATLSSRLTFRIDGKAPDTRILSHDRMNSSVGLFLPITNPRGLALLGLTEGQGFLVTDHEGREERVVLEEVILLLSDRTVSTTRDPLPREPGGEGRPPTPVPRHPRCGEW